MRGIHTYMGVESICPLVGWISYYVLLGYIWGWAAILGQVSKGLEHRNINNNQVWGKSFICFFWFWYVQSCQWSMTQGDLCRVWLHCVQSKVSFACSCYFLIWLHGLMVFLLSLPMSRNHSSTSLPLSKQDRFPYLFITKPGCQICHFLFLFSPCFPQFVSVF